MKLIATLFVFVLISTDGWGQSYVDSGIQHYIKEEYTEALGDFDDAMEMKALLTESSIGKMHYYMGMTWLALTQSGKESVLRKNPARAAYEHLRVVSEYSSDWEKQVAKAYQQLSELLNERAEGLSKQMKKADDLEDKLKIADEKIQMYQLVQELGVSYDRTLNLGIAMKEAGDLIFEETTDIKLMLRAKGYYERALPLYEEARYDDPFSKDIISDMITLAERLADQQRLEEYQKLMELAGG